MPPGVLARVDGMALARYCDAYARWKRAAKYIEKNGETYEITGKGGGKYIMPRPQLAAYHKYGATLLRLEQEFGLTPSSRSRINVPDSGEAQDAGKGRFFPRAAV